MIIQYENKAEHLGGLLKLHEKRLRNERLTSLSIVYCSIRTIGELPAFSCTSTLQSLKINYCELSSLVGVEQLANLTELEVKYNNICSIGPISKLQHLVKLNLIGNPVCEDREDYAHLLQETAPHLRSIKGE